jgi:signal transduction histidine kinase
MRLKNKLQGNRLPSLRVAQVIFFLVSSFFILIGSFFIHQENKNREKQAKIQFQVSQLEFYDWLLGEGCPDLTNRSIDQVYHRKCLEKALSLIISSQNDLSPFLKRAIQESQAHVGYRRHDSGKALGLEQANGLSSESLSQVISRVSEEKDHFREELRKASLEAKESLKTLVFMNRTSVVFLMIWATLVTVLGWVLLLGVAQIGSNISRHRLFLDGRQDELLDGVWLKSLFVKTIRGLQFVISRQLFQANTRIRELELKNSRLELMASCVSDGFILLRGYELIYANFMGKKLLGLSTVSDSCEFFLDLSRIEAGHSPIMQAIKKAIFQSMPIQYELVEDDRRSDFLIHVYLIQADDLPNHSLSPVLQVLNEEKSLDPIYLIRAQDVNLMTEMQEAKTHFLGTLSHEVRTPVTSLTMAIRLLQRSSEKFSDPVQQNLIDICAKDIDRLRGLIEEFMGVSELNTLSQNLNVQKVEILKLITHSVHSFRAQARDKEIVLSVLTQPTLVPLIVEVDAVKISWVLAKLINNAIRHTPRGGKVDVYVEACEDWVDIGIRDTGPGIEGRRIESIFGKYSSHYDLRVGRSGSVGLSLAISKDVITAHGGKIEVKSKYGEGSTFILRLPMQAQRVTNTKGLAAEDVDFCDEVESGVGSSNMKGAQGGTDSCGG